MEGERAGGWGGGREGEGAFTGPRPGAASPGASHTRFPAPALPLPLLRVHLLASTVQLMQGSQHAKHKRDGAVRADREGLQDGHGAGVAPLQGTDDPSREKREGGHREARPGPARQARPPSAWG